MEEKKRGRPKKENKKQTISLTLDTYVIDQLKEKKEINEYKSLSKLIEDVLINYLFLNKK
ncbi:hypothetical protein SAMN02745174_02645 [Cetobacterium ceti]|uniref:Ribbon-helix-helix protein, copG family n=1 Tax=Cetobacterium ceti TaxID=180163 RepID=A0A1T4RCI7_9FUSO|nr:hypothetical protein [Cetobacterium ceti]SKA13607.1 hypothetical protein SAMN02745174_02645 [Cetobacterium ceti]